MKKGVAANVQSVGLHSPVGRQSRVLKDVIDMETISKILEGDPVGAAKRVKISILNDSTSKRKRMEEESQLHEQDSKVDLKKSCVKPYYSSTPCPSRKRSSVDSDCCLSSTGSFEDSEADTATQHHEFIIRSQWECAERDCDLDDSLLEPSDDEQVDSPFRLTEDEITSLLDDNFVATELQKCPVEVSSCEISYWHARNQGPEISESKLSPVKNTVSVSGSESPGEWAERLHELPECDTREERLSDCKKQSQLEEDVKCGQVVNMPFDFDIDELLALSPIDGSSVYSVGDDFEVEEPFLFEKNVPLKEGHDHVTESSQDELIASSKPNKEQQDAPPVLLEQKTFPGKVVKETSTKSEMSDPSKTFVPSKASKKAPLIKSCIVVPQYSTVKDTFNSQKLTNFLLQMNKSLDSPLSSPVVSSSSESTSSSSNSSDSQSSESSGPKNAVLSEFTETSTSNAKPDKEKDVVSSKYSATVVPAVKKLGKVAPIPKVENRPRTISPAELERKKQAYMQCVLKHIRSSEDPNQDAYDELLTLMNQVASVEYRNPEQSWQHPSDLTTRNFPRFAKKQPCKYSLSQWIDSNGGTHQRFHNLADRFKRSSVVAFSSL